MPPDAYTLAHVCAARVEIDCEPCKRHGSYATDRLKERFGADITLPNLKDRLVNCPHLNDQHTAPCHAVYSQETRLSWQRR